MNGATFWAQKRDVVKSADSPPAPAAAELPQETQAPPKKPGLVLKDATNATKASFVAAKKSNWADSDEDDDFLTTFAPKQDSLATALRNTIASKDAQIDELEAVVTVKDIRIEELENTVQEKAARVLHLESCMTEQAHQLEQLRSDNNEQSLHINELVAEVDERDRQIEKLEAELDEKGAMIHKLEMDVTTHAASSPVTTPAEQDAATQKKTDPLDEVGDEPASEDDTGEVDEHDAAPVDEPLKDTETPKTEGSLDVEKPLEPKDEPKVEELVKVESPQCSDSSSKQSEHSPVPSTGPTFGNSDFPLFVTKETLKIVPPAPKPKKMSFPIDLSKYGKKSEKSSPTSPTGPKKGNATASSPPNMTPKQTRAKSDTVPDFNPTLDIRQMDHGKRALYANGPQIHVKLGETVLAILPKYVFMQCSGKGYKHFTKDPNSMGITFPADSMDAESAKAHLAWMFEMTYQGRVYSVTLNTDPKFDSKNLKICRAARVLGLNNTYVGHFTKQLCDRIRNNEMSFEFMDMVCGLAYLENDPVFDCLANNLVNQRLRDNVKDDEEVDLLLAKHANLKKKMRDIEKRVQNKHKDNPVPVDGGNWRSGRRSRGASKDRKAGSCVHIEVV